MSGTLDAKLHREEPETIKMPTGDWWGALRQYGFTTVLAGALIYYLAFFVVEPMRLDQKRFMDSVIQTNALNATTAAKQTDISQQQAKAMQDIIPLLQQIRDDQRRGAWNEPRPKGGSGE